MWTVDFPSTVEEVRTVRLGARDYLEHEGVVDDLDVIEMLMSELLSNAVRHGDAPLHAAVDVTHDVISVEVADSSRREPIILPKDPTRIGGNGMRIISTFAHAWGIRRCDAGKAVWFDVTRAT